MDYYCWNMASLHILAYYYLFHEEDEEEPGLESEDRPIDIENGHDDDGEADPVEAVPIPSTIHVPREMPSLGPPASPRDDDDDDD
eukprot:CAMPEP_0197181006 /NCGR_PEP_ID=MMETSP1423-20130617/5418_1 /TAXON_ID=476441 /ORGANISM="Pseudo-nitzschia heimii, Strain UNC1101" /LENGTH=84 /DNA_ID=CAMNT_0042631163 /DNA_START=276 /DNA_END=527 /DNA_ORIENTATION=-